MDPPTNPSFSLPDHLHASSGAQDLVAADLSLQLGLATPQYPELNSLEFNGQGVTGKLRLDQPQQSESSVNQRRETPLSSNTSSDISHFRKLLRKVNYKVELTSDTQGTEATSGTAMMDGRGKIDDKSAVHRMVESLLTRSNDYNILFQPPSTDQYLAYNEEGLRQTILKHEAVFKNQVSELHRLYGRQMELMDEIN